MSINNDTDSAAAILQLREALGAIQSSLSLPHLVALLTVALRPGLSVNELADELDVPQQTASRHVAVLTGRYQGELSTAPLEALIVQQINESDPRRRALHLTLAGVTLVNSVVGRGGARG